MTRRKGESRESYLARKRAYNDCTSDKRAVYRAANKEKIADYQRANLDKRSANQAKRRANKIQACGLLTQVISDEVEAIYSEVQKMGADYHVDHIIPLQGENVCGLHVPWNLQIVNATLNLRKGNGLK